MKRYFLCLFSILFIGSNIMAADFVRSFQKHMHQTHGSVAIGAEDSALLGAEQFAKDAVLALYTLGNQPQADDGAVNVSEDLARASHYFAPVAWQKYVKDFQRSGNKALIQRDGLLVTARLNGVIQAADIQRKNESIEWVDVKMPFVATYRAYHYKVRQFLEATVRVQMIHNNQQTTHQIIALKLARTKSPDEKIVYDRSKPGCPLDDRH